jgi:hypothetical protein
VVGNVLSRGQRQRLPILRGSAEGFPIDSRGRTSMVARGGNGRLFAEQSRSRFEGEVIPCSFEHHTHPIPQPDEEKDVNDGPERPGYGA